MRSRFFALLVANIILALFLTSPFWIWNFLDEESVTAVSRRTGNNALAAEYIYHGRDIDVLFIGSSQLRAGVNHESLREGYRAATGKDIDTLTIAHNWDGLDLVYFKLRDFLENNKTNLVVVESPNYDPEAGNYPHPDTKFFFRISDDPELFWELPKTVSLKLYAEQVLVAPRLLLGAIVGETGRDEMHKKVAADRGALLRSQGFGGQAFQPTDISAKCQLTVDDVLLSSSLPDEKLFGIPIQHWERQFLHAIDSLLKQNSTKVIFVRFPYKSFAGTGLVERNSEFPAYWDDYAFTNEQLFGDHNLELFYYDRVHLNTNGASRFGECMGGVLADMESKGIITFSAASDTAQKELLQ